MHDTIDWHSTRIYAIGDIHGRSDLLDRVADAIGRDLAARPASAVTVTLGDYVDRGPDARGVIERLARNPFPTRLIALKGNHEDLFGAFLRDPSTFAHWTRVGGLDTMQSYGVRAAPYGGDINSIAQELRAALPPEHLTFLNSLKVSIDAGRYFLCHAGVRPGVAFEKQAEHDLIWIRNDFLESGADHGKIVVHGHTPVDCPEVFANRINIDTGAYASGRLTCVALERDGHRFLAS